MNYLNLCNEVYSHIQSTEVQNYYINEIKDNITYEQLMFLIRNGFYSLKEKFNHYKELVKYIGIDNISESIANDYYELLYIEHDFYTSDNVIYAGGLYEALNSYHDKLSANSNLFYGKTFEEFISNILSFKNSIDYIDEYFVYGYVDKVNLDCTKNFVRYALYNINGIYTITDGTIYENNNAKYITEFPYPGIYRYPFKTGDKLVYKTPLMLNPFYGEFNSEIDGNGTYYAFLKSNNGDDMINLSSMFSIFEGYQSIDWINKINRRN